MAVWCQTPVISRMVDAASYAPTQGTPDAIVSVFGTNLAATTATAQAFPLPRQLGGTTVTFFGTAAPLLYVSPTQINFQVPSNDFTPGVGHALGLVVSTDAGNSAPYDPFTATPNAWGAAGIFSSDGSGCGQGSVENVANNGSVSMNSPFNSASPGGWISVYGTGLAPPTGENGLPPDDVANPLTPLFEVEADLRFDLAGDLAPWWSGFTPGYAGVNQINAMIPTGVREGCAVPIQVEYDVFAKAISQPVTLAIRKGGGPCVDPPAAGYGQITWQRSASTTQTLAVSESDTMTVSLQASPGKQAPPAPVYSDGASLPGSVTRFGPSCPVPGYRSLGAGTVTMQVPGLGSVQVPPAPFQQGELGGLSAYQATLPSGTIQAGQYTVTANGGADVGPFQSTVQIGSDVQIQTAIARAILQPGGPFTIGWTGGDPNSWVTVSVVFSGDCEIGCYQQVLEASQARTSKGTLTFVSPSLGACGRPPTPTLVTIRFEVDPDPAEITAFSALGLSLGGQATWKYLHTFEAYLDCS
jgi:uncharacterized protein (TIGR03437 family)